MRRCSSEGLEASYGPEAADGRLVNPRLATTVLVDSGTNVLTGKSQLRVANLAAGSGAIEISGPVEIPEYGRRTILLLDSPVGPRFVVVGY